MQKNIIEYLNKTVQLFPEKIAVIEGENQLSFVTLDRHAKLIAQMLLIDVTIVRQPVAVFLPKSINSIIANIGITYSGNIYMNLDIKTPLDRISNIVELIQPKVIITDTKNLSKVQEMETKVSIINIDEIDFNTTIDDAIIAARLGHLIDKDPYCIINTSGSTGTPKGVVLNHKSFVDFTEWALETFDFGENEIIGSLSPLVFDIYSFELCMLMAKGSTMVLIPDGLSAFPIKILELLQKHKVSFLFWVPTIMVNIANMDLLTKLELPDLKTVWFAGEVFPTKQFNYWKRNLPQTLFANLYGPIEITLDCVYYIIDRDIDDNEALPIGVPCKNTDVLILNDQDLPIAEGEDGELCVRGTCLAMGYYNNPDKTKEAFVQNPLNQSYLEIIYRTGDIVSRNDKGEIIFKGRKDSLVKHLGYRIELGEIEHVIVNTLKMTKNGCIIYDVKAKEIVLFYEAEEDIPAVDFRKKIATALPKYMVPTIYERMAELPRNTNGKIDRLFLKNKVNQK